MTGLLAQCQPVACCQDETLTRANAVVNPLPETLAVPWEALPQCTARALEVPRCFNAGSTCASDTDGPDGLKNPLDSDLVLNQALRCFMRSMMQGVQLELLLDDGSSIHVEATFDIPISNLLLSVNDVHRSVALDDIDRVLGPQEAKEFGTSNHGFLNERCTTLMLKSSHFLTFVFDTPRLREYFQACFKTLIASHSSGCGSVAGVRIATLLPSKDEAGISTRLSI